MKTIQISHFFQSSEITIRIPKYHHFNYFKWHKMPEEPNTDKNLYINSLVNNFLF